MNISIDRKCILRRKVWASGIVILLVNGIAMGDVVGGSLLLSASDRSLWDIIASGGFVGYLILLMSLAAVALAVEHFVRIRRDVMIPESLVEQLRECFESEEYGRAREICAEDDSLLAKVVDAGLDQKGSVFGFFSMQSVMQEICEREVGKLYRKLEYLSFIAVTAPMMGLLGTVIGMIKSFGAIAHDAVANGGGELASGISIALITTCMGLVVAIPSSFFVSMFRNRIEGYVAEAECVIEDLMGHFRQGGVADQALSEEQDAIA